MKTTVAKRTWPVGCSA